MKITIYCPDIECESCVRVIQEVVEKLPIEDYSFSKDTVVIDYDAKKITPDSILVAIRATGFRAGTSPFPRRTFSERFRDFTSNKKKYYQEYKILKYSLVSLIFVVILQVLLYFMLSSFSNYGWWIFYANISAISIIAAVMHIKSYRYTVTHMVGMMIGMTFGMQTGMMIGTIIGATNGMFIGSMTGMLLGVLVGGYNGKCCGVMGVMEGMMSGVMGGTMGGMLGVMMNVDHIMWFMPIFTLINIAILIGLSYMLFEEAIENNNTVVRIDLSFMKFFFISLIAVVLLSLLIIYGPKTGVAALI